MLGTGRVEIEALILVLLSMLRAGVTIMDLNGESRTKEMIVWSACQYGLSLFCTSLAFA